MKITKRQLRRIIKEEKKRLLNEARSVPGYPGVQARLDAMDPAEELFVVVKDAILELFVMNGEVRTADVFDHLRMNGLDDDDISVGIEALGEAY